MRCSVSCSKAWVVKGVGWTITKSQSQGSCISQKGVCEISYFIRHVWVKYRKNNSNVNSIRFLAFINIDLSYTRFIEMDNVMYLRYLYLSKAQMSMGVQAKISNSFCFDICYSPIFPLSKMGSYFVQLELIQIL